MISMWRIWGDRFFTRNIDFGSSMGANVAKRKMLFIMDSQNGTPNRCLVFLSAIISEITMHAKPGRLFCNCMKVCYNERKEKTSNKRPRKAARQEVPMQLDDLFLKACQNGQKSVVITFLKKGGINVDKRDQQGFTPLHYACKKGARDIVKLLIENNADVNMASNTSVTPLHFAASLGNQEIIQCLLDAGADVNATDKDGKSILIYSVLAKKVEAAKYLIGKGADVSIKDNENRTAVDYANALGLPYFIADVSVDSVGETDAYGNTPLHQSCFNGQSEVVKVMLAKGNVDVNAVNNAGETPLFTAVGRDNIYVSELLLDAGALPDKNTNEGVSPLHAAAANGNEHMVDLLIRHNADINGRAKGGETALIIAAEKGLNNVVSTLLEKGADVTCTDEFEHTALYYATENGFNEIVELLLMAGAEA